MSNIYKNIKVFICDVDGTLTDGTYRVSNDRNLPIVTKSFHTRDFYGIEQLLRAGIKVLILTSSNDGVILRQMNRLRCHSEFWRKQYDEDCNIVVKIGVQDKMEYIESRDELRKPKPLWTWENIAYIGDAENDVDCMARAGFSGCPLDATGSAYMEADRQFDSKGGHGAVYDFAMEILENIKGEEAHE